MCLFDCSLPEPSLILQLPGREVPRGICNILGIIFRDSISSSNVMGMGFAASSPEWGLTTAGTLYSVVPYFLCPSWKWSAASPHPGCVNASSFICFGQNLSMYCCTVSRVCPSPGQVHHRCSACPASYLNYLPHPPDCLHLQDCLDCLR